MVIVLVASVVTLPAVGFPTARNTALTPCGPSTESFQTRVNVPGSVVGTTMQLSGEQVAIAASIIAEGRSHNIPGQGWVVALATALQESGLRDLDYGDRDSRGPFQQRPSAGWGTIAEVTDVTLSIRAFYGVSTHTDNRGLVDIPGWEHMSVTQAAQAVQVSGFPGAYAKWETTARAIVQQLRGTETTSGSNGGCAEPVDAPAQGPASALPAETGLTPDALLVIRCAHDQFPTITSIGGVRADPLPDHPSGRAIDLMIPNYRTAEGKAFGWQVAQWMRAYHERLGVQYVIFDAKIWNITRDDEGWRPYGSVTGSMGDTAMHLDHVHVTVFGSQGTGAAGSSATTSGRWTMPLPPGSYTVGCSMTCYPGHTGQDFPVAIGTPVRSSNDGIVIRSEALKNAAGAYVSYGNLIVIEAADHPNMTVWYGHLSERYVNVGDRVTTGQLVGISGSTGHSDGPHLHYEIRVDGVPIDPIALLQKHTVSP